MGRVAQRGTAVAALLALACFAGWALMLAASVSDLRAEHEARDRWLRPLHDLQVRFAQLAATPSEKIDAVTVRHATASALDIVWQLKLDPLTSTTGSETLRTLADDLSALQSNTSAPNAALAGVGTAIGELAGLVRADNEATTYQLSSQWQSVNILVALALLVAALAVVGFLLLARRNARLTMVESHLSLIDRGMADGVWHWDVTNGKVWYSRRWALLLGLDPPSLEPAMSSWLDRVHPQDLKSLRAALDRHLAGETAFLEHEYRLRHTDGEYRWVRTRGIATTDQAGNPVSLGGSMTDLTDSRAMQERLQAASFIEDALASARLGVAIIDPAERIVRSSGMLDEMLDQWDSLQDWWRDVRKAAWLPAPAECTECGHAMYLGAITPTVRSPVGQRRVFQVTWAGHDHAAGGLGNRSNVLLVEDITGAAVAAEESTPPVTGRVPSRPHRDALTGLADRAEFRKTVVTALAEAQERSHFGFAVVCVDLDSMGLVNDTLGASAGDRVLRLVARRLERAIRDRDLVARIGGDEFGLLVRNVERGEQAEELAVRLQNVISEAVDFDGQEVIPTVSVGVALSHAGYESGEAIIRQAETALRRAVKRGHGMHQVIEGPVLRGTRNTLRLNTDLRRALDRGEFTLFYQPLIPLKPGLPVGFEALIRWEHPTFGMVSPAEFIPLAEATGAIVPVGLWVLREACFQLVTWQHDFRDEMGDIVVSVNVSARQLSEKGMVQAFRTVIEETGVDPSNLKLEITESVVMENAHEAIAVLEELETLGVKLWVDDFGTGYSSLAYLQRLPIHGLKIDRTFVSPKDKDPSHRQIVQSVIDLGHNLDLEIVAEGVETEDQLAMLHRLGCDFAQGYHFSKPVPAVDATDLLTSWRSRFDVTAPEAPAPRLRVVTHTGRITVPPDLRAAARKIELD